MSKPKPECRTAEEAEAAFYAAFSQCDLQAMQALWARDDVVCVHPGSAAITGYEAVMRSWEHIFSNAERPMIRTKVIQCIASEDLVLQMTEEYLSSPTNPSRGAVVLASNSYRRDAGGWSMVAHHASVMPVEQAQTRTLQ